VGALLGLAITFSQFLPGFFLALHRSFCGLASVSPLSISYLSPIPFRSSHNFCGFIHGHSGFTLVPIVSVFEKIEHRGRGKTSEEIGENSTELVSIRVIFAENQPYVYSARHRNLEMLIKIGTIPFPCYHKPMGVVRCWMSEKNNESILVKFHRNTCRKVDRKKIHCGKLTAWKFIAKKTECRLSSTRGKSNTKNIKHWESGTHHLIVWAHRWSARSQSWKSGSGAVLRRETREMATPNSKKYF
jgi:hypothetical protein